MKVMKWYRATTHKKIELDVVNKATVPRWALGFQNLNCDCCLKEFTVNDREVMVIHLRHSTGECLIRIHVKCEELLDDKERILL